MIVNAVEKIIDSAVGAIKASFAIDWVCKIAAILKVVVALVVTNLAGYGGVVVTVLVDTVGGRVVTEEEIFLILWQACEESDTALVDYVRRPRRRRRR